MRRRNARNSLLGSVLLMLLSCAMLLGTTFAWFSDTTTSGAATIQAGNLKVKLEYAQQPNSSAKTQTQELVWQDLPSTAQADLFSGSELFVPDYTGIVYFRVKNAGSLDLTYEYQIVVSDNKLGLHKDDNDNETKIDLTDYIQMKVVDPAEDAPLRISEDEFWSGAPLIKDLIPTGTAGSAENVGRVGVAYDSSEYTTNQSARIVQKGNFGSVIAIALRMPSNDNVGNANCEPEQTPSFKLAFNVTATQVSNTGGSVNSNSNGTDPASESHTSTQSSSESSATAGTTENE